MTAKKIITTDKFTATGDQSRRFGHTDSTGRLAHVPGEPDARGVRAHRVRRVGEARMRIREEGKQMSRRGITLKGAAAGAFLDAQRTMTKAEPTDDERYNALALGIHMAFAEGTKGGVQRAIESLRAFELAAHLRGFKEGRKPLPMVRARPIELPDEAADE